MKIVFRYIIAIIIFFFTASSFASNFHYAIIIDAGSTGSRLHLFQYTTDKKIPEIVEFIPPEITQPGLSAFEKNPDAAVISLKPLLDTANRELEKHNIDPHAVPISILGTAGMRLLNPEKQKLIYNNIIFYIKNHYQFPIKNIETISGKSEGIYAWLDVNYLENNFQTNSPTVGIIDMGGASTQIAFAASYHQRKIIFSKSFLGLGQDKARDSMNKNHISISCYPKNYILPDQKTGNFNFSQCSNLYADVIKKHGAKQSLSLFLPFNHHQKFIAYSSVYYSYNFFNILNTSDQPIFEKNIQSVCNQPWDRLQKKYPNNKYLDKVCANGSYINQLIYHTYRLQGSQLTVKNQINHKDIDWALGALLYPFMF